MSTNIELNMSQLSLSSNSSEDWDRSMSSDHATPAESPENNAGSQRLTATTPRNSVIFPANGPGGEQATPKGSGNGKRSLSELLRLHAEKGTDCSFSTEEAARVADVLGQWINEGSSPYEGEDDFFARDDSSLPSRRSPMPDTRPRGHSEGANSRPPSAAGSRS
ncbi:hypothetical protein C8J56DRAFT_1010824 [Mycena floridula]|nr:hypothetical protein C8J56DRAFT_1010824 [Mycena floridula]